MLHGNRSGHSTVCTTIHMFTTKVAPSIAVKNILLKYAHELLPCTQAIKRLGAVSPSATNVSYSNYHIGLWSQMGELDTMQDFQT